MATAPWTQFALLNQPHVAWKKEHLAATFGSWTEIRDEELFHLKKEIETSFTSNYNWDAWKKICNPYEYVYTPPKDANPLPSVSLLNPLSRSYFKMWEILYLSKITQALPQRIRTAHVCEGPGGFIQAIYDAAERARKHVIATTAMTLRPDHPSVPGWKRASQFLRRHKTVKIEYGPKNDGNILDPINQDAFIKACGLGVHIFTADGGFDFSDEYDKQELNIYNLLVNSSLLALQVLLTEGSFILKIFDVQSRATEDLLALLGSQFKQWTLYKPATSRPCNSEKYFIGTKFRGRNPLLVEFLKSLAKDLQEEKIPTSLLTTEPIQEHEKIREQIRQIQKPILESQKHSICSVLEISKDKTFEQQREDSFRDIKTAIDWCSYFHIPTRQNPLAAIA